MGYQISILGHYRDTNVGPHKGANVAVREPQETLYDNYIP